MTRHERYGDTLCFSSVVFLYFGLTGHSRLPWDGIFYLPVKLNIAYVDWKMSPEHPSLSRWAENGSNFRFGVNYPFKELLQKWEGLLIHPTVSKSLCTDERVYAGTSITAKITTLQISQLCGAAKPCTARKERRVTEQRPTPSSGVLWSSKAI